MPTKKRRNRKQKKFTVADPIKGGSKDPSIIPVAAMADPLGSKVRMMEGSSSVGTRSLKVIAGILLASLFLCLAVVFAVMYAVANSSSSKLSSSGKVMGEDLRKTSFRIFVGSAPCYINQQLEYF